ncbi:MAG: WGR domain-containing protein [Jaaginema sp. PMC 1079.18]|nr:WGR domain-containing protein [Jaaginema sp. PMC 1080.18]MEC4851031.1 WGR domain-containing protein [Jaaginema sp. PMC 1079.18]MEC4865833.1 WGR domain-containing protein [Jaaginema sp. PMC 1078.18]
MTLIQRTTLYYQDDNSDKVYEVDLACITDDQFVVNFRYGRRGGTLKEGTKTQQPTSQEKAQKEFDKLVASKVKKGYQEDDPDSAICYSQNPANGASEAILRRLKEKSELCWSLNRVIWRAGELKLPEATPLLIPLLGTDTPLRDYCIAAALGRCGGEEAIPPLQQLWENPQTPDFVKYMAWEALFKLADETTKLEMQQRELAALPESLQAVAQTGTPKALKAAFDADYEAAKDITLDPTVKKTINWFRNYRNLWNWQRDSNIRAEICRRIEQLPPQWQQYISPPPETQPNERQNWSYNGLETAARDYNNQYWLNFYNIIEGCYRIDNETTRGFIVNLLKSQNRNRPFSQQYVWQRFRHIFKMAQYRQDWDMYVQFAYHFDIYKSSYYWSYSPKTRNYFRRRIWRTLQQLAETNPQLYVEVATSLLKQYRNEDKEPIKISSGYYSRRNSAGDWESINYTNKWDVFADRLLLNHIIYGNSPRYIPHPVAWRCQADYNPGDTAPNIREESYPQLWEQHPDYLLQLLLESDCTVIQEFAAKVLQDCPNFWPQIDDEQVITFLQSQNNLIVQLGFNIARSRYPQPNLDLIKVLLNCVYQPARQQAYDWLRDYPDLISQNLDELIAIAFSPYSDNRGFLQPFLTQHPLPPSQAQSLCETLILELLDLTADSNSIIEDVSHLLLTQFEAFLQTLNLNTIRNLVTSNISTLQRLGIRILLIHEIPPAQLPSGLIDTLLDSPFPPVRELALQLFSQLPDEKLLKKYDTILAMAMAQQGDIRQNVRPIIRRLARSYPEFNASLATEIITLLLLPEQHENVHSDCLELLTHDLPGWMAHVDRDIAMQLLRTKSSVAQELGGLALQENYLTWGQELTTAQIVKLANHQILAVRQAAWQMVEQLLNSRIRYQVSETIAATRLLESTWEDSRTFARNLFESFTAIDWSPEVIVSICDSTRENVRQFGRNLALQFFERDCGQDYLLKFSEHPSGDMQQFATRFLVEYASGNLERLQQLTPYFVTVLSQVNRGRIAKDRVFAFLETEAIANPQAASIVAEILTRQSLTIAIADKAKAIQIMLKLKQQYPQLNLPLVVQEVTLTRS